MRIQKLTIPLIAAMMLLACNSSQSKTESESTTSIATKPNILIIVADDMGFSDMGAFGGNIQTPVLDKVSKEAVLFSNFHVQPTCSPTRSSLLSGNDNHVAGFGIMSEMDYPALHSQQL